jgi:hypothetical protein
MDDLGRCATASGPLDDAAKSACARMCEISKQTCRDGRDRLVTECSDAPCLQSCSADGTPIQVSHTIRTELPSGRVVTRAGKAAPEFLMAAEFTRAVDATDAVVTNVCFRDPIPLLNGKDTTSILESCFSQWKSLRRLGHRGGAIQHYSADRAVFEPMKRSCQRWHSFWKDSYSGCDTARLWLLEWVVFTACALHDCQNAVKWSMRNSFSNEEFMKNYLHWCCVHPEFMGYD